MSEYRTHIELEVDLSYDAVKGRPAKMHGDDAHPAEEGEIIIWGITIVPQTKLPDGTKQALSLVDHIPDAALERLAEEIGQHLADKAEAEAEDDPR